MAVAGQPVGQAVDAVAVQADDVLPRRSAGSTLAAGRAGRAGAARTGSACALTSRLPSPVPLTGSGAAARAGPRVTSMVARDRPWTKRSGRPCGSPYPAEVPGSLNQSWTYAEGLRRRGRGARSTRAAAPRRSAASPSGPARGAALRLLAAMLDARSVVEIGTGTGVSGVWLLRGHERRRRAHHRSTPRPSTSGWPARRSPRRASPPTGRGSSPGAPSRCSPASPTGATTSSSSTATSRSTPTTWLEALRLLRPGGVVAFDNALWSDRVADPAQRDPDTVAIRELGKAVRDHEDLVPALLPVGDGLLLGVRR